VRREREKTLSAWKGEKAREKPMEDSATRTSVLMENSLKRATVLVRKRQREGGGSTLSQCRAGRRAISSLRRRRGRGLLGRPTLPLPPFPARNTSTAHSSFPPCPPPQAATPSIASLVAPPLPHLLPPPIVDLAPPSFPPRLPPTAAQTPSQAPALALDRLLRVVEASREQRKGGGRRKSGRTVQRERRGSWERVLSRRGSGWRKRERRWCISWRGLAGPRCVLSGVCAVAEKFQYSEDEKEEREGRGKTK
jgi:hypothetical protein